MDLSGLPGVTSPPGSTAGPSGVTPPPPPPPPMVLAPTVSSAPPQLSSMVLPTFSVAGPSLAVSASTGTPTVVGTPVQAPTFAQPGPLPSGSPAPTPSVPGFSMAELAALVTRTTQEQIAAAVSSIGTTIQQIEEARMAQAREFEARLYSMAQSQVASSSSGSVPFIPSSDGLPHDPANPWRYAMLAPREVDLISFEGLGTRPLSDFEFAPDRAAYPNCFMRLTEAASVRTDKIPKETVILPREKVQSTLLGLFSHTSCENTRVTPPGDQFTTFQTSPAVPNPLTSKLLEAAYKAVEEGKPCPTLRELEQPSLLLPADNAAWSEVAQTFSVGKLLATNATEHFKEELPRIPNHLLKKEHDARERLKRSLSLSSTLELIMSVHPAEDLWKVVLKQSLPNLLKDLYDFMSARKECRQHVVEGATLGYEPNKLVNGTFFGQHLFPSVLAQEAIEGAVRAGQTLKTRWGLSAKRTASGQGFFKNKKKRGFGQQQQQQQQHFQSAASRAPLPSTSSLQVLVPAATMGLPASSAPVQCELVPSPRQDQASHQRSFPSTSGQHRGRGRYGRGGVGSSRGKGNQQSQRRGGHGGRGNRHN